MKDQKTTNSAGLCKTGNILSPTAGGGAAEFFQELLKTENVRIERIISHGHKSEDGFWYDQEESEWVLVVQGEAQLEFEPDNEIVHLTAGMYVNIPTHVRHRVKWTREDCETIWLAVFYKA